MTIVMMDAIPKFSSVADKLALVTFETIVLLRQGWELGDEEEGAVTCALQPFFLCHRGTLLVRRQEQQQQQQQQASRRRITLLLLAQEQHAWSTRRFHQPDTSLFAVM